MTGLWILSLVGLTTAGAYLVGRRKHGLSGKRFLRAVARTLDGVGMGIIFFAANVLAGAILILAAHRLTGKFISIYHLQDFSLVGLSLIQGLVFQWWREPPPPS